MASSSNSSKETNYFKGHGRKPNSWNRHQKAEAHQGKSKANLREGYIKKSDSETESFKTNIRCRLTCMCNRVIKKLSDQQKEVIKTTPFASLLELETLSLGLPPGVVKTIAQNFDWENMVLKVCIKGEYKEISIEDKHFVEIMDIKNGEEPLMVADTPVIDRDLLKKYCVYDNERETFKHVDFKKVEDVLFGTSDEMEIKQSFAILAMLLIVYAPPSGKMGWQKLWYVKDVNSLNQQPWAKLAMEGLQRGICAYHRGKGKDKNIGGCMLFLELYCMKLGGLIQGLTNFGSREGSFEVFHKNWKVDHAPNEPDNKILVNYILKDLKSISSSIKDRKTIERDLLLEFSLVTQTYLKKFSKSFISIGPFEVCSSKATDNEARRIVEWVYTVENKPENFVVAELKNGWSICMREMREYLNSDSWLNRWIIDYVAEHLCVRACVSSPNPKCWYFPTSFEKETMSMNSQNIQQACEKNKWTKLKTGSVCDLRDVEQFFVPVHDENHFKLVVVSMKKKVLELWDTLSKGTLESDDVDLLNRVGTGLDTILEWEETSISTFTHSMGDVLQQKGSNDCGVHVCHFMEYPDLAFDKQYEWHSAEERYNLAVRILTAKENLRLTTLDTMVLNKKKEKRILVPNEDKAAELLNKKRKRTCNGISVENVIEGNRRENKQP